MKTPTARLPKLLLCLLGLCLVPAHLGAQDPPPVLGSEGTVFRLHSGSFGELFPGGYAADAASPVLALDVLRSDGTSERRLVPGTESADLDSSPTLVYESSSGELYLLWERLFNGIHPLLYLTSFDGSQWSELIEVASAPFSSKGSLQLAVTRETADVAPESRGERTLLHVTWWEESPGAASRKRYSAIVLEQGRYLGWAPVIDLGQLARGDDGSRPPVASGLEDALRVQKGRNDQTVVLGFLDPLTHRLEILEIEAVPQALSDLADRIRAQIVAIGAFTPPTDPDFARTVRERVLELGAGFHEAALVYMADWVYAAIRAASAGELGDGIGPLAERVRAQIVAIGSRIRIGGLETDDETQIVEIGKTPYGAGPYHHLKVFLVAALAAPEVGGPARLFLSETGRRVIVSWEEGDRVYYRESSVGGWGDPCFLDLGDELDRPTVYRMLEERVRAD